MKKEAVVVAGPNGAGKTTLVQEFLKSTESEYHYLSADLIAAELSPEHPEKLQVRAGKIFIERLQETIKSEKNILVESTLSGKSFERFLKEMEEQKYSIKIIFIFLDRAELCIKRVAERVKSGGHNVPEEDIKRRFERSIKNFWENYRTKAKSWHLFYNATENFEEVAVGEGENYTIIDEELFEMFRRNLRGEK